MQRQLDFPACYNVRDLGGLPIGSFMSNGSHTHWKAFVRADSLYRLTSESQRALVDYGVRTVIDLRSDDELQEEPNPFRHRPGMWYVHVPMIDPRNADALSATIRDHGMLAWNLLMLDLGGEQIAAVMRAIADAPEGGVAFHCYAGKDRTGLTAMMLLSLAGVPRELIAEDYDESNTYLGELNQQVLARFDDPAQKQRVLANLRSGRENMLHILAHLETKYGGAERYLLDAGLTAQQLERIRQRLQSASDGRKLQSAAGDGAG
jgi:protein tyrosine/serine phosphatase